MRRITASCWASFMPNTPMSARVMLKSLFTTSNTPWKCVGRDLPHITLESFDSLKPTLASGEYISSGVGRKTRSAPSAPQRARSAFSLRGYAAKSSLGANCAGFTKIETMIRSAFACALRMSERCPSCRKPIVGTIAMRSPSACQESARAETSFFVFRVFMFALKAREARGYLFDYEIRCGGAGGDGHGGHAGEVVAI